MATTAGDNNNSADESTQPPNSNLDDIYGQKIINESQELLSSSLLSLDKALEDIPDAEKSAWTMALEKCPELCGEKFKLMFLRCAHFECDRAAHRIVAYWTKRLELFTPSKAFLPMVLGEHGAMKDDTEALSIGYLRLIPGSDDVGHPILFIDPSQLPREESRDRLSMVRAFWYNIHAALESEEGQIKGVLILVYPKKAAFWQFDRKLGKMNVDSIRGFLPVRVSAFHICHPPAFFRIIFPVMKLLMGEKLRKRVKPHYGEEVTVVKMLGEKYGIPQKIVPTELGGELVLENEKWLQNRQKIGL